MATDMRPHQRRNRRDSIARSERAQAEGGATPVAAPGLERTLRRVRSGYRRRAVQEVFDELNAVPPGPGHLKLMAALLGVQATEERHLLLELERALEKARPDNKEDEAKVEGIREMLQEHRRSTRHIKGLGDGMLRAVKIQAEIEVGSLPAELRVKGASAIAQFYAGLAGKAAAEAAAEATSAALSDPSDDSSDDDEPEGEPTRH